MLGDQFVGCDGTPAKRALGRQGGPAAVNGPRNRPGGVLDELSLVLLEKLIDGFLHVAEFVQARRLVEHKTVSRA